jgi:hypothetical protein
MKLAHNKFGKTIELYYISSVYDFEATCKI